MKVNFKRIVLRNYGSYKSLDLEIKPGRHLITGGNGSGKSTVFEGLTATLYPEQSREKNPTTRGEKESARVEIEMGVGSDHYKVQRTWKSDRAVQLWRNTEQISVRLASEIKSELERLVPLTSDLFTTTVVVTQGLPLGFMSLAKTARKMIVEELVGSSVWGAIKSKFEKERKLRDVDTLGVKSDFDQCRERFVSLETKLDTVQKMRAESNADRDAQIVDIKTKISGCKEQLTVVQNKLTLMAKEGGGGTDETRGAQATLRDTQMTLQMRQRNLKKTIEDRACPECSRPFPDAQIKAAEEELPLVEEKLGRIVGMIKDTQDHLGRLAIVERAIGDLVAQERTLQQSLTTYMAPTNDVRIDPELIAQNLKSAEEQLAAARDKMNVYEKIVRDLKYLEGVLVPSSKFRTDVLSKYVGHINQTIAEVVPVVFPSVSCCLVLSEGREGGLDVEIRRGDTVVEYRSLSGGEKKRIDVIFVLAFQRVLQDSSGVSCNLLVFDEIFDGLDQSGVEVVLAAIETLFSEASSIYVISHQENLKSHFSSVLRVSKDSDGSSLEVSGDS